MAKLYRFTVPETDTEVIEWLDAQDKVSTSMRLLIKQYVATHGQGDIINTIVLADGPRRRQQVRDIPERTDTVATAPAAPAAQATPITPVAPAEPVSPAAPVTPANPVGNGPTDLLASLM